MMPWWARRALLALAGMGGAAYLYARAVEPNRLVLREHTIGMPSLDPVFDGYRIAHLSDLHVNGRAAFERFDRVIALVNAAAVDLIVITGDFVTASVGFDGAALTERLRSLCARDGIVAVMGNHDHRAHAAAVRRVIAESGLVHLPNAVHTLRRGAAALHIAGLDSVYFQQGRFDHLLAALPPDGAAILLAHEPDIADLAAALGRFDLQLSGHAHGGQVRIPVLYRMALPFQGSRYVSGLYYVKSMIVYVSAGLGMTSHPVRFNSPPEVTILTLLAGRRPADTRPDFTG